MASVLLRLEAYDEASAWCLRLQAPADARRARGWRSADAGRVDDVARRNQIKRRDAAMRDDRRRHAFQVVNLGRFQILRDGAPLPPAGARKAVMILRYLLTRHHHAAHKEELMDLMWPESAPREAAHSLHVAVSALRRHMGGPPESVIRYQDGHYELVPDAAISDDCDTFWRLSREGERMLDLGDRERAQRAYLDALDLYQGDYCIGEVDAGWAVAERERLLGQYLTVLDRLGRLFMAQGLYTPAIECYQRLLQRDAYREDAHAQLIRCLIQIGQRSQALRRLERCTALLAEELGLEPGPDLQELHQAIRHGAGDVTLVRSRPA
jgi:DNA-binding SARP family transcriptional activator